MSDVFHILLGACALGYSFVPPNRVRGYRRSVALLMRLLGVALILLAVTSVILKKLPTP